jgi:hypothetical protein
MLLLTEEEEEEGRVAPKTLLTGSKAIVAVCMLSPGLVQFFGRPWTQVRSRS